MTQIGYFQRPLSTILFITLLISLTLMYLVGFKIFRSSHNPRKEILKVIIIVYTIVFFAYPAFSHDIFNYLFDARIVTKYNLSPYYFRALDFPNDPWTRFMRWTHRYYPYGPLWLSLTIVPSVLGKGSFILTILLFKLLFFSGALGNALLIKEISQLFKPRLKEQSFYFFALNPLVVIESIYSPHNEVFLLFFSLIFIYLFLKRKYLLAFFGLLISLAIKFVTVVWLPLLIIKRIVGDRMSDMFFLGSGLVVFVLGLLPIIYLREPYPWYFLPVIAYASLFSNRTIIFWLSIGITLGTSLRYASFLWYGSWNTPVPEINSLITIGIIVIGLCVGFIRSLQMKQNKMTYLSA